MNPIDKTWGSIKLPHPLRLILKNKYMENKIHIVTKIQSDYDYDNPTVLFATDNLITADSYALKGDRVLTKLTQFYLERVHHFQYELDYTVLTEEEDKYYDELYEIYDSKYERFKRTEFRVDTIPLYITKLI